MKTLFSLAIAFSLVLGAFGQDDQPLSKSELKKLQKEQKKAEQAAAAEAAAMLTEFMVTGQKFVLEADYLSDKTGTRVPVQSMINFLIVDSLGGTVQFGSASVAGYNGVGGSTIDGKINNYKINRTGKKQNSFTVNYGFSSSVGHYDITLMVNPDGNTDASIRGNWGGNLNYHGRLVPVEQSRVYKGTPRYY
jgi:hypothetical protein